MIGREGLHDANYTAIFIQINQIELDTNAFVGESSERYNPKPRVRVGGEPRKLLAKAGAQAVANDDF